MRIGASQDCEEATHLVMIVHLLANRDQRQLFQLVRPGVQHREEAMECNWGTGTRDHCRPCACEGVKPKGVRLLGQVDATQEPAMLCALE